MAPPDLQFGSKIVSEAAHAQRPPGVQAAAWPSPDGLAPAVSATPPVRDWRPAVLLIAAVGLFAVSDVFAKLLSGAMPGMQIAAVRYVMVFGLAFALLRRVRQTGRSQAPAFQIVRGLAQLGAVLLFILGLGRLDVGQATAVSFVTPVLVTALSIPILGEVVRGRRWAALGLSLIGVLIVVRPGAGAFEPALALPLGSALCGAVAVILTRRLGTADAAETTMFWSAAVGLGALLLLSPLWLTGLDGRTLALAAAMGLAYAAGQYLLIRAYSAGEASLLAPFSYAQVIVANGLGALVFGVVPTLWALLGIGLIVASGAYTLWREHTLFTLRLPLMRLPRFARSR
jgi:drug/metabolite transporter (DMT)-like permease